MFSAQLKAAVSAQDADPFARDIRILTTWFEGDFDNEEQLWFQNFPLSEVPEEEIVERLHYRHTRLAKSSLGEFVFLTERYLNNDPSKGYESWIVSFTSSSEKNGILMRQARSSLPKTFKSQLSSDDLDKIVSVSAPEFDPGCDVLWSRKAGQFEGRLVNENCDAQGMHSHATDAGVLTLSDSMYWKTRQLIGRDASATDHPAVTYETRKAKWFVCDMYFYSEQGDQFVKGIRVHSQGGTAQAVRESDGRVFEYLIREKAYPYYSVRPDFIYFSIRPEGEKFSSVFSVSDVDSRRIGMRTPEIGAFCHLDGYQFQELLETL